MGSVDRGARPGDQSGRVQLGQQHLVQLLNWASGPALYRHFSGKDEILAALFNEALDELLSATATVYDDPAKDLERLIRHHVGFAVGHQHLVKV